MEAVFIFLIKSSGLIGMFYLSYFILLRKETFFNSNRWFLLAGLFTSVLLPLIVFTKIVWIDPSPASFDWSKIPVTTATVVENDAFKINWYLVFTIVYSIGIVGFLMKFAFDFYSLSKILKGRTFKRQADFKFIDITENISPFSYFNCIVYNSSLYSDIELENILEHEKVHSEQNHTVDVLISTLFCIVFWFNPLVWLYKKAIVQNLEFIADSEASKSIFDKKAYQLTLLKITTQENCVAITNHFYQSLIKKRIIMLNKNQSKKWSSWKYATVLPLLGAFVFLFQVKVVAQEKMTPKQENQSNPETTDLTSLKKEKEIYSKGMKSPKDKFSKLNRNATTVINGDTLKIPAKNKSEIDKGTIDVTDLDIAEHSAKYTIKTIKDEKPVIIIDGKFADSGFNIEDIDPNKIRSINVFKGKIAEEKYGIKGKSFIEVTTNDVNEKNEWAVSYGVNGSSTIINTIIDDKKINYKKAAIVIDEKISDYIAMEKINSNKIKSILLTDLKNAAEETKKNAVDKYGEKAANGIIEIKTKSYGK